ncbi:threonine/serine exporter family protein [Campylobacter sp.]|uniref:threonine/serine exporter family protein n=1 Tax=Campylobacter sp. TaxID=205 RepID=UPI0027022255|nr:threonine/serine exporter family protein [Campylobacter sp.]
MFDLVISTLIDALFAAIAGFGFAYVSSPPKRTLIYSALLAAIAHASRFLMIRAEIFNISIATLFASFFVGILAIFFARRLKVPAEIISFPALLPMVPGIYAYKSILALFSFTNTDEISQKMGYLMLFFDNALTTVSVSLALGVGVSVTLLIFYEQSLMVTRGSRCDLKTKREAK